MSVVAKFKCVSKVEHPEIGHGITLEPVIDGSEENKNFFRYTPSGRIDIGTVNQAAADQFVVGAEYYVRFEPVNMCADAPAPTPEYAKY